MTPKRSFEDALTPPNEPLIGGRRPGRMALAAATRRSRGMPLSGGATPNSSGNGEDFGCTWLEHSRAGDQLSQSRLGRHPRSGPTARF